MRRLLIIILVLLVSMSLWARERLDERDYRGRTFQEISIDDRGIVLVDTLGEKIILRTDDLDDLRAAEREARQEFQELRDRAMEDARHARDEALDAMESVDAIHKFGRSVIVEENELVEGDVVVMGGNATIRGWVSGNVTATGKVRVTSSGVVEGDILANRVIEETGSRVYGSITERDITGGLAGTEWQEQAESNVGLVVILALQLLSALAVAVLFKTPTDRVKETYKKNILKAILIGFAIEVLVLPAFILLLVTVIGIPVALLALPIGLVGGAMLGAGAFCLYVSDIVRSQQSKEEGIFTRVLIGFAVLQAPSVLMLFGLAVGSELIAILFGIVAAIVSFIVITASLGAVLMTRFGTRDYCEQSPQVTVTVSTTN